MKKPIETAYIPINEGMGFSIAVWKNAVTVQKKEKTSGQWDTANTARISKKVLEFLVSRGPALLVKMDRGESLSYIENIFKDLVELIDRLSEIRFVETDYLVPELRELAEYIISAYGKLGGNSEILKNSLNQIEEF